MIEIQKVIANLIRIKLVILQMNHHQEVPAYPLLPLFQFKDPVAKAVLHLTPLKKKMFSSIQKYLHLFKQNHI